MTEIKIKRLDTLTSKQLNRIIEDPNTINLAGVMSNGQRIKARKENNLIKKLEKISHKVMIAIGVILILLVLFKGGETTIEKAEAYDHRGNVIYNGDTRILNGFKIPTFLYDNLEIECKKARDPYHCFKTGLSIAYAESTWGQGKKVSYNYFGLTSKDKSIASWVWRYNKYWYTATNGTFFYGANGQAGRSHYCMSEESSGTEGWCPNGLFNFNYIYDRL